MAHVRARARTHVTIRVRVVRVHERAGFGCGFVMPFMSVHVQAPGVPLSGQAHMNGLYIKQPPQKFTRHVGKQHAAQAGAEHV